MGEFSLLSSISSLLQKPQTKEIQRGELSSLQSIIQQELDKNPGHRRESRSLTEKDIQEAISLLPKERQALRDVYIRHFSQEYWAARVVQSVLAIKNFEDQNPNRRDTSRFPYRLMAELRNSVMGFYMREFMARREQVKSGFQLSSAVKDEILQIAGREFPTVVRQLWQRFGIQTSINLSSEGNNSDLVILEQELSAMMDIYNACKSIQGVTDVLVQPAAGTEDVEGKVDCYVLLEYGNRGYEQYAVQIKQRHYHRREEETEDRYILAGTGREIDGSRPISGLYYKEKDDNRWYRRRRNPDGTLRDEEDLSNDNFSPMLEVLTGQEDSNHGIDSPYFLFPRGVDPYNDVQYYTAFWLKFSPSGGTNRR